MQVMGRMSCLHLPQGLQSDQQTMQVVYHAKQSMCASHKTALSMLSFATSPLSVQMNDILTTFNQELWKNADMHPEIIVEWPDFTVCKDTIKEILNNT